MEDLAPSRFYRDLHRTFALVPNVASVVWHFRRPPDLPKVEILWYYFMDGKKT